MSENDPQNKDSETSPPNEVDATKQTTEPTEIEQLRTELEQAKKDYLYLRADFDNYRKKAIEERSQWLKYGSENLLRQIVSIVDNFDLALLTEVNADNIASFEQGVRMIRSEISSTLANAGVTEVPVLGEAFNPQLHEAIGTEESAELADGHVLRVLKKAYKLHDRNLRPAQVIIAKKPSSEDNEA